MRIQKRANEKTGNPYCTMDATWATKSDPYFFEFCTNHGIEYKLKVMLSMNLYSTDDLNEEQLMLFILQYPEIVQDSNLDLYDFDMRSHQRYLDDNKNKIIVIEKKKHDMVMDMIIILVLCSLIGIVLCLF